MYACLMDTYKGMEHGVCMKYQRGLHALVYLFVSFHATDIVKGTTR